MLHALADLGVTVSHAYSPLKSSIGGATIGVAATIHLAFNGRVTGISGIWNGIVSHWWTRRDDEKRTLSPAWDNFRVAELAERRWKKAFVGGMLAGGVGLARYYPSAWGDVYDTQQHLIEQVASSPDVPVRSALAVLLGGFLVGVGTRMGSGCTSGHGVCGLARLSKRSLAAVTTFLSTSMLTATAKTQFPSFGAAMQVEQAEPTPLQLSGSETHPVTGVVVDSWNVFTDVTLSIVQHPALTPVAGVTAACLIAGAYALQPPVQPAVFVSSSDATEEPLESHHHRPHTHVEVSEDHSGSPKQVTAAMLSGALFAGGLGISGMTDPNKVMAFLDPTLLSGWDPSLLFVLGSAVGVHLLSYHAIRALQHKPLLGGPWHVPTSSNITSRLIIGSAIFGVGWGMAGICPGPGLVGLASGDLSMWAWVASLTGGMYAYSKASS